MFSSSVEVHDVSISLNCILLSVTYNFDLGKWTKIERNDSKPLRVKTLLMDWGVNTCSERTESVKRYARIVWASLISSLEVARYDCLPHRFSPTFQPPLSSVEIGKKKKAIFNSCLNRCNFWKLFRFGYSCFMFHDCPLAGNKRRLFEIFLLFNSITSAVTACNVGVFKKTWANTWISFLHHRNQFQTSIKFSLKFKSWVDVVIGYIK